LPDGDGLAVLRKNRKDGKTTPVVVATASVDGRAKSIRDGADDYLAKLFTARELVTRLLAAHDRPDKLIECGLMLKVFVESN
jgi:DNA-binding response OmpR family regulator